MVLGEEVIDSLPDRLDPRNAVKGGGGGQTEVFKMHTKVTDVDSQVICYLDVNSFYPYVMSKTKFPVGHPTIRRGHASSCINLMNELKRMWRRFYWGLYGSFFGPKGINDSVLTPQV